MAGYPDSPNRPYLPAVDHLRACFALLVVTYHAFQAFSSQLIHGTSFRLDDWLMVRNPLLAVIVEGHTGVAAFMVLSGFIFVHGTMGRKINYLGFIRNRLLRIYPLYLLLVFMGASLHPEQDNWLNLIRTILPLANIGPPPFGIVPALGWTVAVEFQFYLVFPLLFALLERHGPALLIRMVALLVTLRLVMVLLGESVQPLAYWTIAGRLDQFLIGMLSGWLFARHPGIVQRAAWQIVPAVVVLVALLFGFNRLGGWPALVWWKALWPTVEATAWAWVILSYIAAARWWLPGVASYGLRSGGLVSPGLVSRALAGVGRISFSVYLLHFPIIEILSRHALPHHWGNPYLVALSVTVLLAVPLILALAAFSYATVEAPFLALRTRYTQPS